MFKPAAVILSGALLFLAGCATAPVDNSEPPPPDWVATNAVVRPPVNHPVARLPVNVKTNLPPVLRTNPAPVKLVRAAPILTWTSLNRWAAEQKLAPPRKLANSPVTAYAISSPNGTMTLEIGSRDVTWNGLTLHFGFAPEIIDDQVFIYGLDLQKNLEPLLLGGPLAFGSNRLVVIDPGHGGINVGTHSVLDGRFEREFTLDWARRLKPLLETNGWRVLLTRTNDVDVSLSNRVAFAEARRADLFISLHFNSAAPDKKQAGLETYCLTPTGMPSTLTRNYADLWSESFANNAYDTENLQLAIRLQRALLLASGEEDRGVRRARFMGVLHGQHRPAVLIEGGYLSNPHEAERIATGAFRQKLAEAIACALK